MSRISNAVALAILSMVAVACGEAPQSEVPRPQQPSGVEISARTAEEFLRTASDGWNQLGAEDFVKTEGNLRTRVRFGQTALLGAMEQATQRREELLRRRSSESDSATAIAEAEQQIESLSSLLRDNEELPVHSLDYKEGRTCPSSFYKAQSFSNGDSSGCYAAASTFYDALRGPIPGYKAANSTACVETPDRRNCQYVDHTGSVSMNLIKPPGDRCRATAEAMLYDSCGIILLTTEAWGY